MILCDTGPLIALIDHDDANHLRCCEAMKHLPPEPLITTWPCLTEAMYLLSRADGFRAQDELWSFVADDLLLLHLASKNEWQRMRALMQQYADTPMDLGDASLVAAAESLRQLRIFTLDQHFRIYRFNGTEFFDVID